MPPAQPLSKALGARNSVPGHTRKANRSTIYPNTARPLNPYILGIYDSPKTYYRAYLKFRNYSKLLNIEIDIADRTHSAACSDICGYPVISSTPLKERIQISLHFRGPEFGLRAPGSTDGGPAGKEEPLEAPASLLAEAHAPGLAEYLRPPKLQGGCQTLMPCSYKSTHGSAPGYADGFYPCNWRHLPHVPEPTDSASRANRNVSFPVTGDISRAARCRRTVGASRAGLG